MYTFQVPVWFTVEAENAEAATERVAAALLKVALLADDTQQLQKLYDLMEFVIADDDVINLTVDQSTPL